MPITFSSVYYTYNRKTPFESEALQGVDLALEEGKFIALVGRTGSGKSTLIQHLNALLSPTSGEVRIDSFVNAPSKRHRHKDIKALRQKVGLVFQFPEYQLFEETVEKDVAFGPKNFGDKTETALNKAHVALSSVGLDSSFYARSPFELSGGEKRKVAIAGVLAMEPKILVVDEPTAGLDPEGASDMMALFERIHQAGTTVILVTHDMNLVLRYADYVVVMEEGKVARTALPSDLFAEDIGKYSLERPLLYSFVGGLEQRGLKLDEKNIKDIDSLAAEIVRRKQG
jgi:energy-coupling factor transport system ATP-binding protein